jgi:hypothetical protein
MADAREMAHAREPPNVQNLWTQTRMAFVTIKIPPHATKETGMAIVMGPDKVRARAETVPEPTKTVHAPQIKPILKNNPLTFYLSKKIDPHPN